MKNSIDLTRIRSIKTLQGMKKDLEFFINEEEVKNIYLTEMDCSDDDLAADREDAEFLIEKINLRIKSLEHMNSNPSKEKAKQGKKKSSVNENIVTNDAPSPESNTSIDNTSSIISLL